MNITFCGHKASHSWVEQLAAGSGGGAIRSRMEHFTTQLAAAASQPPKDPWVRAQTICSHLLATVTMSTELELEMSLCMTISALSLHASTTSRLYLGRCSAGRGGAGWGCLQAAA